MIILKYVFYHFVLCLTITTCLLLRTVVWYSYVGLIPCSFLWNGFVAVHKCFFNGFIGYKISETELDINADIAFTLLKPKKETKSSEIIKRERLVEIDGLILISCSLDLVTISSLDLDASLSIF